MARTKLIEQKCFLLIENQKILAARNMAIPLIFIFKAFSYKFLRKLKYLKKKKLILLEKAWEKNCACITQGTDYHGWTAEIQR